MGVEAHEPIIEYVTNKDAPVFRVHGLHDIQILVSDGVLELYRLKRSATGALFAETELFVEIPISAVSLIAQKIKAIARLLH